VSYVPFGRNADRSMIGASRTFRMVTPVGVYFRRKLTGSQLLAAYCWRMRSVFGRSFRSTSTTILVLANCRWQFISDYM